MSSADGSPLVSTTWLAAHLGDPGVRIIDVRWQSRYENGRGTSFDDHDGYRAGHIPNAVFAGMIAGLSDPEHPVPDMLAPPERFASAMNWLGIGGETLVVAYDNMGFPLGSARLWWALNYYGHDKVRVLDGGLRQWVNEGRPLTTEVPDVQATTFEASPSDGWLATKQDVCDALGQPSTVLVDCLTPELYRAAATVTCGGNVPVTFRAPSTFLIWPMLIRLWRKRPRLSAHVF